MRCSNLCRRANDLACHPVVAPVVTTQIFTAPATHSKTLGKKVSRIDRALLTCHAATTWLQTGLEDILTQNRRLKSDLLLEVAPTNRGALASRESRSRIDGILRELEGQAGATGETAPLEGEWELLYSDAEQFRSSPFFWAFQNGLVQDRSIAEAIFRFTDSIPGATVGRAVQSIYLSTGSLVSDVVLEVYPGLKGSVVTTSSILPVAPDELIVTVESTKVSNTNLTQFLENIVVPVKSIVEGIRGAGATSVRLKVTYVDDQIRISRTLPDEHVFVYRRLGPPPPPRCPLGKPLV